MKTQKQNEGNIRNRSKKKTVEKIEFTQDYIPLKEIRNGIIETTDGRYIKILEIEPISFLLRSSEEQFNIIGFNLGSQDFKSYIKIR